MSSPAVAYVVRSFPRLSQTFVLDEILAMERLGVPVLLFPMTDPQEAVVHPEVAQIGAPVRYLDRRVARGQEEALLDLARTAASTPLRYAAAVGAMAAERRVAGGYSVTTPGRCLRLAVRMSQALRRSGRDVRRVHAHFAHDPALVALLVHRLTGIPFSFTAHARDLYQLSSRALVARAREAQHVVTCCSANRDHLRGVLPPELWSRVSLVHHGVDLKRFAPAADPQRAGRAGDGGGPPLILSVGRLVEKKGFGHLVEACGRLRDRGIPFRCVIYGEGPDRQALHGLIGRLGLAEQVVLAGPRIRGDLVAEYRRADLFALTPVVTADGDRDGIPNVLLEAMASGLAVLTTSAGGIPEVVRDGANGLMVPPGDVEAVASSLARLIRDPGGRRRLGEAARSSVEKSFDARAAAHRLAGLFGMGGVQMRSEEWLQPA